MKAKELIDHIAVLRKYRYNYEPDWYRDFHAYENNTFVAWNRIQQSIVRMPFRKRFFMSLPEVNKQADSFENLLLTAMPLFVVYPEDISDDAARKRSVSLSKILKHKYLDWDSENLIHRYVHLAIKYPVSFWEVNVTKKYDSDGKKWKYEITPQVSDVFDWLYDPRVPFEENRIVVKILRKTMKEIKEFKLFDGKTPTDGSTGLATDFKEMIFNDKYGTRTEIGDFKTYFVYQVMEKLPKGILMQVIDRDGNVLKKQMYDGAEFYPVVPLQLFSGDAWQPSFVQNIIPIQRSLSIIANRIEDFILKFVKGSYLVRDGSDVSFSDENGLIVTYSGEPPTVMEVPQLSPAITQWFTQLFTLSERYGINGIASGGTPAKSNMRAGKMMQQSVDNQRAQQKTPMDNLSQAFKRIAEITMFYLSEYTDEETSFTFKDNSGDFTTEKFIGEKYKQLAPNATPIPKEVKMDVEIEDISAVMIHAKREAILELAKEFGAIPPPFQKVLLDLYRVGSTADIMEDMDKAKTLLDSPEFQALIAQARAGQLPPEEQQALVTLLKFLSQQSPTPDPAQQGVPPAPGQAQPMGGAQAGGGGKQPPPGAPKPPQQDQGQPQPPNQTPTQ